MSKQPKILIIYTGGTIGMISDPITGALQPFNFEQLVNHIPSLKKFGYQIDNMSFEKPIDSSDINPEVWIKLSKIIKSNHNNYDGFVILHGTDTMAYSASALSFMLENLHKPVIFTGSQLPLETLRTDGKENIITAIEIAAALKEGKPTVPEVCIYFETKLYRGNRTRKYNAKHFDAFESPNYPSLAQAGINIVYNYEAIHYTAQKKIIKIHTKLDTNVVVLKIFPGINQEIVSAITQCKSVKAIILESFGSGNAPTSSWFINTLKEAIDRGVIILNITQCNAGSVEMGLYQTGVTLEKIGVVSGYDMTTEAAITKLMFLLGQNLQQNEIKYYLNTSIAGELKQF